MWGSLLGHSFTDCHILKGHEDSKDGQNYPWNTSEKNKVLVVLKIRWFLFSLSIKISFLKPMTELFQMESFSQVLYHIKPWVFLPCTLGILVLLLVSLTHSLL